MSAEAAGRREPAVCPRCGPAGERPRFVIRGFRVVDCAACGLRFVSPRLPEAAYAAVYDQAYFQSPDSLLRGYDDYAGERPSIVRTFRRRFAEIARAAGGPLGPGRYLDIGCAFGYALEVAAEAGLEAQGVDVSAPAVARARERGLEVIEGGTEAAERVFGPRGPMRLATSWDVIEHLPDPGAHLLALGRLAAPGGLVSIITPDRGSLPARLLGRRWVEYQKPEEHIYFFRGQDISALAEAAGLAPVARLWAGKYVAAGFAARRLEAYAGLFRLFRRLPEGLAQRALYVDPRDKMHLIFRKR